LLRKYKFDGSKEMSAAQFKIVSFFHGKWVRDLKYLEVV
jgi:hypothetical protein